MSEYFVLCPQSVISKSSTFDGKNDNESHYSTSTSSSSPSSSSSSSFLILLLLFLLLYRLHLHIMMMTMTTTMTTTMTITTPGGGLGVCVWEYRLLRESFCRFRKALQRSLARPCQLLLNCLNTSAACLSLSLL